MNKIPMQNPIVEMDGDEMARILWSYIKNALILPYVDLSTEYYDLGLPTRDATGDAITLEAAQAIRKHKVGVKCATITPNAQRMKEYSLKAMYKSPNGTIRSTLDGTVFRKPIVVNCIRPAVRNWIAPITIARHAYGDIYRCQEQAVQPGGKAELVVTDAAGQKTRQSIFNFDGEGVVLGMYNTNASIASFARACFNYALDTRQNLWFSSKDTISKVYDGTFRDVFSQLYESEYKAKFVQRGIEYFYTLIDDAVARVMRSPGGFIWACKNYDGDVMSDMIASAFGSLAMMTSVLVSPDGCTEFEAAHGTITKHYHRAMAGERTSTNPMATLFAWTGALRKRGQLDDNAELCAFADKLEHAAIATIQDGVITQDLVDNCVLEEANVADTRTFIAAVAERMQEACV